jgi:hypothetical protein
MAICGCTGGGVTTCEAIAACLRPYIGRGLRWNAANSRFEVCLSTDAGNVLTFGADNCLYSPGSGTPPPDTGRKTIEGLPEQAFSAADCGALIHPPGSIAGTDHAIANNIDIVDVRVYTLTDNVSAWAPFDNNTNIDFFSTNPAAPILGPYQLSSNDWKTLYSDAGNPYNPCGNNNNAPAGDKPTGRDQNWFGWRAPTQYMQTTLDMLRMINARAVVFLKHDTGEIDGAINAVLQAAAQPWVIIFGETANEVSEVLAGGIVAGWHVNINTTVTPAEVVASGATWVYIRSSQDTARIQSFINAGLEVVVHTDSTHYETTLWHGNGARVVAAWDPVYARNQFPPVIPGSQGHRTYYETGTTKYGHLTRETGEFFLLSGRGYALNTLPAQYEEPQYQWDGGTVMAYASTGMGYFRLPDPADFPNIDISWTEHLVGAVAGGAFAKSGLFVCFADDRDFATPNATVAQPGINGYFCYIRTSTTNNGQLQIARIDNGLYTLLGTSPTNSAWTANSSKNMSVRITPTTIRIFTGSVTIQVTDATYRGRYIRRGKEENSTNQFTRAISNVNMSTFTP